MNGYVFGGTAAQVGEKLVCLVALRKVCFTKQGLLAGVEALHSCSKPGGLAHTCTEFFIFCGRPHFNSYNSSILENCNYSNHSYNISPACVGCEIEAMSLEM